MYSKQFDKEIDVEVIVNERIIIVKKGFPKKRVYHFQWQFDHD